MQLSGDVLAAIYGGVVGGVLGITGALLGAVVQRRLQKVGKVRATIVSTGTGGGPDPNTVRFVAEVWFYNEKEVSIRIHNLVLRYLNRAGDHVGALPLMREGESEPIRYLNLPAREYVRLHAEGSLQGEQAREMQKSTEMELIWTYPSGKEELRSSKTGWDEDRVRRFGRRIARAFAVLRGQE